MAAQNESLSRVVKMDELTKMHIRSMQVPYETLVKTPEQIAEEDQQRAEQEQQPDPAMLRAQAEMERINFDRERFQHEQATDMARLEAQQRQVIIENQRHMQQVQARFLESESRLQVAMRNLEVAVMQAQLKAETESAKMENQRVIEEARLQLKAWKDSPQMVMNQESLELKRRTFEEERQFARGLGNV
jgi:hypothetical protein